MADLMSVMLPRPSLHLAQRAVPNLIIAQRNEPYAEYSLTDLRSRLASTIVGWADYHRADGTY